MCHPRELMDTRARVLWGLAEWELGDSPSSPSLGSDSVGWLRAVVWDAQVLQGPLSVESHLLGRSCFWEVEPVACAAESCAPGTRVR